jgi:outer membrane lipoprotein-sorting protein
MRNLFSMGLVIAIMALAVGSPLPVSGQSAGLVSSVLNKMERNRESLKSLRAGISMEKYDSQLRSADRYHGTVLYLPAPGKNASIRIEWESPQHEILAVSKGEYTLFRPRLGIAYKGKATQEKRADKTGNILELMNLSRQQLESRFLPLQDVWEETLWGGVSTIHLKLVPKGNASFKYAEVWVDSLGMPIQSKIVEKNDDATTIRLSNLERNVRISADEFGIKLDANVKVVRG